MVAGFPTGGVSEIRPWIAPKSATRRSRGPAPPLHQLRQQRLDHLGIKLRPRDAPQLCAGLLS